MAKVTEKKYGSREGVTVSTSEPSSGGVRTFVVVVDDKDDDPRVTLQNIPVYQTNEQVAYLAQYPWDATLTLRDFSVGPRLNTLAWIVYAIYAPQELGITTWGGWIPAIRTATMTERRYDTIPHRTFGGFPPSPATDAIIYAWGKLHGNVKRVASLKYDLAADTPGVTAKHYAIGPDGGHIDLIQTEGRSQHDAGWDYERPVNVLTMDKDVQRLPTSWGRIGATYKNRTNSTSFHGIPPHYCQFKDLTIAPASGQGGMFWHVQLIFLVSGEPLSVMRRSHTVEIDGALLQVFHASSNKPQFEDFKASFQADMNGLPNWFG